MKVRQYIGQMKVRQYIGQMKVRQYNGQMKTDNNDLQNTTQKTKDWVPHWNWINYCVKRDGEKIK
jgi:hypothetical protein